MLRSYSKSFRNTYFIATPPYRGWQRSEGLLLLHSFLSLDISQMCSKRRHVRLLCLLGTPCEVSPSAANRGGLRVRGRILGQEKLFRNTVFVLFLVDTRSMSPPCASSVLFYLRLICEAYVLYVFPAVPWPVKYEAELSAYKEDGTSKKMPSVELDQQIQQRQVAVSNSYRLSPTKACATIQA